MALWHNGLLPAGGSLRPIPDLLQQPIEGAELLTNDAANEIRNGFRRRESSRCGLRDGLRHRRTTICTHRNLLSHLPDQGFPWSLVPSNLHRQFRRSSDRDQARDEGFRRGPQGSKRVRIRGTGAPAETTRLALEPNGTITDLSGSRIAGSAGRRSRGRPREKDEPMKLTTITNVTTSLSTRSSCSPLPWSTARARGSSPTPTRTPRSTWSTREHPEGGDDPGLPPPPGARSMQTGPL
jgi:hypothetical protein